MDVFDLSASLTLDSTQYNKGLTTAENQAKGFGGKLKTALKGGAIAFAAVTAGVTALSGAFMKGIKSTAEYGDRVDKMSQKIGISAEAYQKWDYVMQRAGGNVNSLKMGLKTLSQQAEKGNESFKELGITEEDLKNLNQEELFEKTVKGLSEMEAGTKRTALASELLGRAGVDMGPLLNQGSKAIEEQMEIAEKYGMIMPEATVKASAAFEDSVTTMQMTMQGMRNRMMGEFLPAITKVTDGLATLFTGDMSGIKNIEAGINGIVGKISELLPKIIEIGGNIIGSLAMAIAENAPQLVEQVVGIFTTLVTTFVENLPKMLELGAQTIQALIQGIVEAIPKIAMAIAENAGAIVEGGVNIILALVDGLITAIPAIIDALPKIFEALITGIIDHLPQLLEAGVKLIVTLAKGLIKAIPKLIAMAPRLIAALFRAIIQAGSKLISAGVSLVKNIISGIGNWASNLLEKGKNLISDLWEAVKDAISDFVDIGENIVKGIWKGIKDFAKWIKGKIKEWVGNVVDFIKDLFGVDSPSKVMRDEVGIYLAQGLALGILDGKKDVEDAFNELMPREIDTAYTTGGFQTALEMSVSGAITDALGGLAPILEDGMANAMEGVQVKLNSRNFGKLAREAMNGTI